MDTYDLDQNLLQAVRDDGQARAQVYAYPRRAVVLGRGSHEAREIDAQALASARVPVLRRAGGGCAVYLDPGNIIVSIALPLRGLGHNREAFAAISQTLAKSLKGLGFVPLTQRGISDLCQGEHKVGGSCIHRSKDLLYYSTTLLVRPELEAMQRFLLHPPREPDYRQGRRHQDFVAPLQTTQGKQADSMRGLVSQLAKALDGQQVLGFSLLSELAVF